MDSILILFTEANVIPTLAMLIVAGYWLLIIVGVAGMDTMDFDLDVDADVGLDVDTDLDVDADGNTTGDILDASGDLGHDSSGGGILRPIFEFLYLSDVPIVIVATALMFGYWVSNLCLNLAFNPENSFAMSLLWIIPNCIVALLVARGVCIPAASIGRKTPPEAPNQSNLIGKIGIVTTGHVDQRFGQMEVKPFDEPEIKINIRLAPGQRPLAKGDAAKIISYNNHDGTFLVALAKWEKNSND